MAINELGVLCWRKNKQTGEMEIMYPINRMEDVEDLPEVIAALQNITKQMPWANITGKPTNYPPSAHSHQDKDIVSVSASKITGVLNLDQIPAAAQERLVKVQNEAAMFALTTAQVQNGDIVKRLDNGRMYHVVNDTKLNSYDGYELFTSGMASSVEWASVLSKPALYNKTEIDGFLSLKRNISDSYNKTEVDNKLATKRNTADSYTKTEVDNKLATKLNVTNPTYNGNITGYTSSGGELVIVTNTTGGWARGIRAAKTDGSANLGYIGLYGGGKDSIINAYMGVVANPWAENVMSLRVTATDVRYGTHSLIPGSETYLKADVDSKLAAKLGATTIWGNAGAAYAWMLQPVADKRDENPNPNQCLKSIINHGLKLQSKIGVSTNNIWGTLVSFHGYADLSGGQVFELYFSNGAIYWRTSASTTTWNNWTYMMTSDNSYIRSQIDSKVSTAQTAATNANNNANGREQIYSSGNITVAASAWTGSGPFTANVTLSPASGKVYKNIIVTTPNNITDAQVTAISNAAITATAYNDSNHVLTLKAFGSKPTVNITLTLVTNYTT